LNQAGNTGIKRLNQAGNTGIKKVPSEMLDVLAEPNNKM
jgi:hypothetical protein